MKRIKLYFKEDGEDADWESFADYVADTYPTENYTFDPELSDDDAMMFVFYGEDEKEIVECYQNAAPSASMCLDRTEVDELSANEYKKICERLDG